MSMRPCIIIPTYDNPQTIRRVVEEAHRRWPHVIVVDDGSGDAAQREIAALEHAALATVVRRTQNGGKGAAVKDGLRAAEARGYTHALQVDADGQHDLGDIPRFLAEAEQAPTSLILGQPEFDASIPKARRYGRKISVFWAAIETLGTRIGDPLCGYRVYPVGAALRAGARGNRMDFDPEIAVRMVWNGVAIRKVSTRVRYLPASEGGVSHFHAFWDNVRISLAHTRLIFHGLFRALARLF